MLIYFFVIVKYSAIEACGEWHIRAFDRNFGRSLLASYSDHYLSDFVLHGTSDADYKPRLLNDLQSTVKVKLMKRSQILDFFVCSNSPALTP